MKSDVRAAVAAIALSHSTGRRVSAVYDYNEGSYVSIAASINGKTVTGYDYANSCHVSGTLPNLYHYGQSAHINFNEVGDGTYNGYDYGSSCHFNVQVRSGNVQIYDYGESGYFSYSG